MSWDLTGRTVAGMYIDLFPVKGVVTESRVKYGGSVQHTVLLDTPIQVFGDVRDVVLLGDKDILKVF